ncbi:ATP-dependent DNA helicase RecQ [Halopolyspora algeriensis]|uniref:ATP-dependent DNA helicase RecQ n=1 Tax=Halopolyspora algeriensis TaxID=1500506 RepID=A0A368VU99_9ACTN|nr:RecQ family ATP-dependent DNA helicase [Halopolyspora algeriensis]RCW44653.1 ATP-dependent DNA helicase RecQ [Halopolyspora algeriensis]TQM56014.1 ATP-dependent DNA helicase RecQ [Halopolyspora algeriensis]
MCSDRQEHRNRASTAEARSTARRLEGVELRGEQEEALRSLLERDTLVMLAPAAGKTLVYEVAGELLPGPTLVVSPTLSLQRDQVATLRQAGLSATAVNSTTSDGSRNRAFRQLRDGTLQFLLVAPEQLAKDAVLAELRPAGISLIVVDEAHCVSEWGHDFRPDYLALRGAAEELGSPRMLALTATASGPVRQEIIDGLGMREPLVVARGVDLPSLHLSVRVLHDEARKWELLTREVVSSRGSGIVYVTTRKHAEEFARSLAGEGVEAAAYHGSMRRAERDAVQDAFTRDEVRVVVATSAFGMGIDKPDVRFVLHADAPPSVDSYYQQVSRAGRDREPARGVFFYRAEDLSLPVLFASGGRIDPDQLAEVLRLLRSEGASSRSELARRIGVSSRKLARALDALVRVGAVTELARNRLAASGDRRSAEELAEAAEESIQRWQALQRSRVDMVRRYAETGGCRRRTLLELLGDMRDEACGRCDNCDRGHPGQRPAHELHPGDRVRHPEWGDGVVQTAEGDSVVVLFEHDVYRTLSIPVVREHGLLTGR